jgi:predicted XRE-type DNA-binding protein
MRSPSFRHASHLKPVVIRSAAELVRALELSPEDAEVMQLRSRITNKIIEALRKSGLTHAQAAKAAGTSQSRLTSILNRNTAHVSIDLLIRILLSLGYQARITFTPPRNAA